MTNQTTPAAARMSKPNSNVLQALSNFKTWIGWHPADYKGAIEFAGDMLETVEEVNCFERELRGVVLDLHFT